MLREYLSTLANAMRSKLGSTTKINAQDFVDKIGEVYDKGLLEGLAQAKAEGRKTKYIEEYFTGSKQYLNYSIDFEPKLIVFLSNDGLTDYETNKPNTNNPIAIKQIIDCKLGFAEGQNYLVSGATAYKYDTKSYTVATGVFTNYVFNQTTGKWDVTLGRADTSTSTLRFVSNGVYPSQILFVGDKEKEEEQKECESKHFVGTAIGDGTSGISFNIPFEPDTVFISSFSPLAITTPSTYISIDLVMNCCLNVVGRLTLMNANITGYQGTSITTERYNNNVSYENGVLTYKDTTLGYSFGNGVVYNIVAAKTGKTTKENTIEQIEQLPNESKSVVLQYNAKKINENFTTEEWESLIATKPNWTFALV